MQALRRNSLKPKLAAGDCVIGLFLQIPSPQLVEILGLAGFDFVIIDGEHGSIDLSQMEDLIRASLSTNISPMVRVPECDPVAIRQPLDMGAAGIHVPQIGSAEAGALAIRSSRYYPAGDRGLQPFVRSASYRAEPTARYLASASDDLTMVFHIEGQGGVEALDGILALDGLDVVFMGPYDLSQSLGLPGQVKHPLVREKMIGIVERARRAGKCVGTFCDDAATAREWRELGVNYLAVGLDAGIFLHASAGIVREIRGG